MGLETRRIIAIAGIIGSIGSIISLVLWYFSERITKLSYQITAGKNLLPLCGFSKEEQKTIGEILLEAEKKLHIESNFDDAQRLYNSVSDRLWACEPKLQVSEPTFMLITLAGILLIFFILFGFTRRFAL